MESKLVKFTFWLTVSVLTISIVGMVVYLVGDFRIPVEYKDKICFRFNHPCLDAKTFRDGRK